MTLFPRTLQLLQGKNAEHILLFGGGIIPKEDMEQLYKLGVGKLFGPGAPTTEIIEYVKEAIPGRRKEEAIF